MCVEAEAHSKPYNEEGNIAVDKSRGDASDHADGIGYDDGGEAAIVIRKPSEEQRSGDGTQKEQGLKSGHFKK